MLPVIISNYNRIRLLKQTLNSLFKNSYGNISIIVVDDGSTDGSRKYIQSLSDKKKITYFFMKKRSGSAACRNKGVSITPLISEFIYFSDNDVYFEKDWDKIMIDILKKYPDIGILGGEKHPHHGILGTDEGVQYSDQQAGYSFLLRTKVWKKIGPFIKCKVGEYGKEDTELCNRCHAQGYKVASVIPPVVIHCGLTTSEGKNTADLTEMTIKQQERRDLLIE